MATTINPGFLEEIKKYGAKDFNACYNCGNCTAVCSLATEDSSFPRELLRFSALGLEDDLASSTKPWECYYCGECSTLCPRGADPGELMMSLRRWLTSKYDWTGLSGLLYRSLPLTILAFVLAIAAVIGFSVYENFNVEKIMHYGHLFEMFAIGGVFAIIILPNVIHMWWLVIGKKKLKIPLKTYISEFGEFLSHMFTQKKTLGCDDSYTRWVEHMILVFGYLFLLFTTVVLDWFGSENIAVIVIGYVFSVAVFIITIDFVSGRMKKSKELNKHSQPSDWLFVIWLFLIGFTSFLVRLFVDLNIIEDQFWMFLLHFTILVQWALIIVPFGKWTHFIYRPFALYFQNIIKKVDKK